MNRLWVVTLTLAATACTESPVTSWSGTIGPSGGRITGEGIEITIPAAALARAQEIRITRTDDVPPAGWTALSPVFRFEPDGLTFAEPLEIRFRTERPDPAERVAWIGGAPPTLEELSAFRAGDELITSVSHFSTGFAGVPLREVLDGGAPDAGSDAGVREDGSSDAGAMDAAIPPGIADISCWRHEVVEPTPAGTLSDVVVGPDDHLYFLLGPTLYERGATGWTETYLPTAASFGPASGAMFGPSDLVVDASGSIHAVVQELSRMLPDHAYPYYVRRAASGWSVEEIPFETTWYTTGESQGPCFWTLFQPEATEIVVASDGTAHVIYDCYTMGAYHPVFHSVRQSGTWAVAAEIPGMPLYDGFRNPQIAVDSTGTLHAYVELGYDVSWMWSSREGGVWGTFATVDAYPGSASAYTVRRGSLFLDDDAPAAFYVYEEGLDEPCGLTPATCSNRASVRRAERAGSTFVHETVQDYAWPISDVAQSDDGTEYLITATVGTYSYVPTGAVTAFARSPAGTWSSPVDLPAARTTGMARLVADHAGIVHGVYIGTDDQIHHIWTCR